MALINRLRWEQKTVSAMVQLYCRKNNHPRPDRHNLCDDCAALLTYSLDRLKNCRFGEEKPVCAQCPVHCYKKTMRDKMRQVMRFSGPRLLLKNPLLSLYHLYATMRFNPNSQTPA